MVKTNSLRLVLHGAAIDDGMFKLIHNRSVDSIALMPWLARLPERTDKGLRTYKVFNRASVALEHDRSCIIGRLSLWFGVDSSKIKFLPHHLKQFIDIPAVLRTDRDRVRYPVQKVQLLDRNGIYLVQGIDDRNVASILRLEDIDQVVNGGVAPDSDIRRRDFIFVHDSFNFLV